MRELDVVGLLEDLVLLCATGGEKGESQYRTRGERKDGKKKGE